MGKIPILTNIFQMGWFNHQPGLPNFGGTLDVPSKLGLDSEVSGMLSLLWMGTTTEEAAKGAFHTDVQDGFFNPFFCWQNDFAY